MLEPPTEQGTLRLHHSRPWEGEEGAIERYEVTLAAAGAPPQ
jgi:hypothetical protein